MAAIPLLDPDYCHTEKVALQRHFKMKRDHVLKRLDKMGLKVDIPPSSTFYIWLNLERLPSPINNGLVCLFVLLGSSAKRGLTLTDFLFSPDRRSLKSCSRNRRLSFLVSFSTLTLPIVATCSIPRAITMSASRSDHRWRISTKGWTRLSAFSSEQGARAWEDSDTLTRRALRMLFCKETTFKEKVKNEKSILLQHDGTKRRKESRRKERESRDSSLDTG